MNLRSAIQGEADRPWLDRVFRVFELPSDSSAIQFLMRHVGGILKRCWMMLRGVAHVSRNDRDAESLWFLEGCRWNLTCSLMNSVRKVRAGIDRGEGGFGNAVFLGKLDFYWMLNVKIY